MNADKVFRQGATHQVCQDYAEAYATGNEAVAILADGCSSAPRAPGESWKKSEFTDWGARLNVRAAKMELARIVLERESIEVSLHDFLLSTVARADAWRNTMQLPLYTLDTTLMVAYAKNNHWMTMVMGDGAVVIGCANGDMHVYNISFTNDNIPKESMPFYPSYNINAERRDGYRAETAIKNNRRSVDKYFFKPDGTEFFLESSIMDIEKPHILFGKAEELKFIALLSDGISSFRQPDPNNDARPKIALSATDVLQTLLPFKSFGGEFIVKRNNRFMIDCRLNKWQHDDDFSLAGVYLGE